MGVSVGEGIQCRWRSLALAPCWCEVEKTEFQNTKQKRIQLVC